MPTFDATFAPGATEDKSSSSPWGATELAESAWCGRQLADTVALQAWTATAAGVPVFLNGECRRYFGLAPDRNPEAGWFEFVHASDLRRVDEAWTAALAAGTPFEAEFRLRSHVGTYRWFVGRAQPVRDAGGAIERWFGTNTDVDGLKRNEEEMSRRNHAKDVFFATLSHELRMPLMPAMVIASALAADDRLAPETRAQLAALEQNISIEARLIDDLLDLSSIIHGRLKLQPCACELHALIDAAIDVVANTAEAKGCWIERNYAAAFAGADADPARLRQVIWNLLHNAIKFTPGGGCIRVETRDLPGDETRPNRIRIEVTDMGIGISPEVLEQIFLPFEQVACPIDGPKFGLGLGLAIARAIVGQHGGTLVARSAGPGHGATFVIELPARSVPDRFPVAPSSTPPMAGSSVGRRILVVDDHVPTLQALRNLLRRDGHDVTTATSVADAFLAAQDKAFDLLISDLGLPDGNGCEIMTALRRRGGVRGIALTGYGMESDKAGSIAAGFSCHLTKPVAADQLRKLIAECARTRPPRGGSA